MTFVNLSLLAGTALVAVPIVLHLIMRRKPRYLEFPALRFIQKRHDTNQRRLRLRHLLLLLLRAGGDRAAGLRPGPAEREVRRAPWAARRRRWPRRWCSTPRRAWSTATRTTPGWRPPGDFGHWLLAQLPPESQIAVLDTRLGPRPRSRSTAAAAQRIERLETVANSQPLPAVIEEAVRLLGQSQLRRKEIYVFTDLSRGAWPSEAARLQDRLAGSPASAST